MRRIEGVVRNYDWGRRDAIADLLGRPAPGHPEAEYWLGTHPGGPAVAAATVAPSSGRDLPAMALNELVATDPGAALGPQVVEHFGDLPFLLKVLAADRPLSIQAHPNLDQARAGFADEEQRGLPTDAPNRNYRDANHKPELICALTPFEAKCGFRPVVDSLRLVAAITAVANGEDRRLLGDELVSRLEGGGRPEIDDRVLGSLTGRLLGLEAHEAATMAAAVTTAAARLMELGGDVADEFSSELEWTGHIAEAFPGDVGVVVALLLNHVTLSPGQAIFLQAGNLHSYLSGVGVELMANSDNVLRGGLTSKHVDPDELLRVVDHRPSRPPVQNPSGPIHTFDVPVPEFALTRVAGPGGDGEAVTLKVEPQGPEILLVTEGTATLVADDGQLVIGRGEAVFVPAGCRRYQLSVDGAEPTIAWRAATGLAPGLDC